MQFEAISPLLLKTWADRSPTIRATGARFPSGLGEATDLEPWAPSVKVLGEWFHAERHPERWRWLRLTRFVRPIRQAMKVVHLRLG